MVAEIHAVYEPEWLIAPTARRGDVAGQTAGLQQTRPAGAASTGGNGISGPRSAVFYTDIDSDIAFSLRNLGVDEAEIARRVEDALTLVDAQHFRHQPIQCLSHGQKNA